MRSLEQIRADILALERKTEGLLAWRLIFQFERVPAHTAQR